MKTSVHLLELPSNLGLIEPSPGKEPGVRRLPSWLKDHGFYDMIAPAQIHSILPPAYSMQVDPESMIRNADAIADYAIQQSVLVKQLIERKLFVLAIGGDCSILIGNMIALKQSGTYALFYLDGHTDFMWPEMSQTHGAAGMDLALVSGNGPKKLANILDQGPYITEENIWAAGNREYDKTYEETISRSKINYYNLRRLQKEGIETCTSDFLLHIEKTKPDGFWIHLDVDVLLDDIMPAVDSREPGGLTYEELNKILIQLLGNRHCVGLEITILDPDLDPDGKYTREFVSQVGNCIRTGLEKRNEF